MESVGRECELGIGMAAHTGEFFALGGGVHGPDADRVEELAESHAEPGALLVTDTFAARLPPGHGFELTPVHGLPSALGNVFRVVNGPALGGLDISDIEYPAPYSSDFSSGLARYVRTRRDSVMPRRAYEELVVVYIAREPEDADVPEVAVLNDLALTAAMKRIGLELLGDAVGEEVKNSGRIGIYTFAECAPAIAFARNFRDALATQGIQSRIGIDIGLVLVFDMGNGEREIAGFPVNVASKLAEDVGEFGMIQVSEAVAKRGSAPRARPTRALKVSGVELRAYDL
jgi:class 3 adenylate cyclase